MRLAVARGARALFGLRPLAADPRHGGCFNSPIMIGLRRVIEIAFLQPRGFEDSVWAKCPGVQGPDGLLKVRWAILPLYRFQVLYQFDIRGDSRPMVKPKVFTSPGHQNLVKP